MAQTVNKAYNDGVCTIVREINDYSSFSARVGATSWDDLETICKMDFADNSIRVEDSEYANQMGFRIDRKISIRRPGQIKIDTHCSAVIDNVLYHIGNADLTKTEFYLSLTRVGDLNA